MTNKPTTPQTLQEQLRELEEEAEKKKVKLTPEVQQYIREHLEAVQDKLMNGEPVFEEDMEFMNEVRMWVGMPKDWRGECPSVEKMLDSEEMKEAKKRHISPKQWLNLLHMMEVRKEKKEWIDKTFKFPGGRKIKVEKNLSFEGHDKLTKLPEGLLVERALYLTICTGLTELPKGLSVGSSLWCDGCTSLTSLPEGLLVEGNLYLSEDMNDQAIKDAEKLKAEGKIKGEIKYV